MAETELSIEVNEARSNIEKKTYVFDVGDNACRIRTRPANNGRTSVAVSVPGKDYPYSIDMNLNSHRMRKTFEKEVNKRFGTSLPFSDILNNISVIIESIEENKAEESIDKNTQPATEFDDKIKEEVDRILRNNPILWLIKFYGQTHKGDEPRTVVQIVSFLSGILTGKRLNDHAIGTSGKGKSHLMRQVFKGLPHGYAFKFESISPKALQYACDKYGKDFWKDKLIFYDDVTLTEEKESTLKAITDPDADKISEISVKDQELLELNMDGLPTIWVSSVHTFGSEALKNRFFVDSPDESSEIDYQVADFQKKFGRFGILNPEDQVEYETVQCLLQTVTEETKNFRVFIPYDWVWLYPEDRRLQPQFLILLYVIAKLNYKKRLVVDSVLFSSPDDFLIAQSVFNSFLKTTTSKVSATDLELLDHLPDNKTAWVSRSDVAAITESSYGKVRGILDRLDDAGFVTKEKEKNEWKYWKTPKRLVKNCGRLDLEYLTFSETLKQFKDFSKTCDEKNNGTICNITEGELNELVREYLSMYNDTLYPEISQVLKVDGKQSKVNEMILKLLKKLSQVSTTDLEQMDEYKAILEFDPFFKFEKSESRPSFSDLEAYGAGICDFCKETSGEVRTFKDRRICESCFNKGDVDE